MKVTNFNPLPLYRGRLDRIPWNPNDVISIHFLYTEEDNNAGKRPILRDISIHFLYTEEDLYIQCRLSAISKFQSTSSIQRKTAKVCYSSTSFNISIHFLYTEEDNYPPFCGYTHTHFNPLPLYRGRHCLGYYFCLTVIISIHFLYTEEDHRCGCISNCSRNFNPLPLYRGRPTDSVNMLSAVTFQSTSSIQRKTSITYCYSQVAVFQSTSSIQRKTILIPQLDLSIPFQSTSSIQRKTGYLPHIITIVVFQSTSSIQRKTHFTGLLFCRECISIHFLYTEEDTNQQISLLILRYFNPLPLYRGRQRS